jgi:hypothetical protein
MEDHAGIVGSGPLESKSLEPKSLEPKSLEPQSAARKFADRMACLRSNVFADMDRAKQAAVAKGQTLIDLSLGSSDLPTPPHILQAIADSLPDPATHRYLLFNGTQPFRQAAAQWYERRFSGRDGTFALGNFKSGRLCAVA